MKTFNNKPNRQIEFEGKPLWISRSVAVSVVIIVYSQKDRCRYVLAGLRGPNAADFRGLMNVPCGYIDWNETGQEAAIREVYEETGLDLDIFKLDHAVYLNYMEQPWFVVTSPAANRQNITLRYGEYFMLGKDEDLPELTIEYNEVPGECESAVWIKVNEISNYQWAFNHDEVINKFLITDALRYSELNR